MSSAEPMQAIYQGWVRHRRYLPKKHDFRYSICLLFVDLERLKDNKLARRLIKGADHFMGGVSDVFAAVKHQAQEHLGYQPTGPFMLLTQPRQLGFVFNPVSFYYVYHDGKLVLILAEVHNTPWNETHLYPLKVEGKLDWTFPKAFHVSPFMPMEQQYRWQFSLPGERLAVHMRDLERNDLVFDATMVLTRKEFSYVEYARVLMRHPLFSVKTLPRIYWQAFLLFLKRVRAYAHPNKLKGKQDAA